MTERSGREAAGVTDAGEGPTSAAAATGSGSEDSWICARRRAAQGAVRLLAFGRIVAACARRERAVVLRRAEHDDRCGGRRPGAGVLTL